MKPVAEPVFPAALYAQLRALMPLTEADFAALQAVMQPQDLAKKELLLREGNVCRAAAYIETGALRYFYTVQGEERTGQFFFEGEWYADYDSFLDQSPSAQSIQALEPTPVFESFGRLMAEQAYRGSKSRSAALLSQSPAERYAQLVRARPGVVQRVSQRLIASYLGVKPESLSRIRGRG